jgi:hypothetical protein
MAVVMSMHWREAKLGTYDQMRDDVKWETNVPKGALFHIAWMADDGFHAIDLWESAEDFQRFSDTRLNPSVQRIGIPGQPDVKIAPVHAVFNARVPTKQTAGGRGRTAARPARPAARKPGAKKAKTSTAKRRTASRGGATKGKRGARR